MKPALVVIMALVVLMAPAEAMMEDRDAEKMSKNYFYMYIEAMME